MNSYRFGTPDYIYVVTLKIRYTNNRKAPAQRPFLLAGELASPAGRVLVVLGIG